MKYVLLLAALLVSIQTAYAQTEDPWRFSGDSFAAVIVPDVGEAAVWYADVFGMQSVKQLTDPDGAYDIRVLSRPGFTVELLQLASAEVAPEGYVNGLFKVGFHVDDADALHAYLAARGVDVDERVMDDEALGVRMFLIRDPFGNRLQVFGPQPVARVAVEAYPDSLCSSCASWNRPTAPRQVHGNTYWVGTRGLGAILIASPGGHVLIDGGLPDSAPLIAANIEALGFNLRDVRVLLHSHQHFDHAGGLEALRQMTGGDVCAPVVSAENVRNGVAGPDDPQYDIHLPFPAVRAVRTFTDGDTLRVGNVDVVAHLTEVHAPGGTTWTWRSCDGDACLDMVYADSQTPVSADGYRFSDHPVRLVTAEAGYRVLESLSCDILMTPHPGASRFWQRMDGVEPLVDTDACRRYGSDARQALARRLASESD